VLFPFARDAYAAKRELDSSEQELKDGEEYKRQFEQKLEELKTDEGIEDQAHSLNLTHPDEKSVIVTGLDDPEGPAASYDGTGTDGFVPPPGSWLEEWLDTLFGIKPSLPSQSASDGNPDNGQAGNSQAAAAGP
jgi:hypothetical protein